MSDEFKAYIAGFCTGIMAVVAIGLLFFLPSLVVAR